MSDFSQDVWSSFIGQFLQNVVSMHCRDFSGDCEVKQIKREVLIPHELLRYVEALIRSKPSNRSMKSQIFRKGSRAAKYTGLSVAEAFPADRHSWPQYYVTQMVSLGLIIQTASNSNGETHIHMNVPVQLSWDNLKEVQVSDVEHLELFQVMKERLSDNNVVLLIRLLFWYFRKGVVDSLLQGLAEDLGLSDSEAFSVGSTNLESDYDVTVYSSDASRLAIEFQNQFKSLFGGSSSRIFDTNIYGCAFIDTRPLDLIKRRRALASSNAAVPYLSPRDLSSFYCRARCGSKTFWYMQTTPMSDMDQYVWVLLKLLRSVRSNHAFRHLEYEHDILRQVSVIDQRIAQYEINYDDLVYLNEASYGLVDLRDTINLVSFANAEGSETYYTRAAFLDVVVNQQTCKGHQQLKLSPDELLQSVIENLSDFIGHGSQKYLDRSSDAALKLLTTLKRLNRPSDRFQGVKEFIHWVVVKDRNKLQWATVRLLRFLSSFAELETSVRYIEHNFTNIVALGEKLDMNLSLL